jgi:hypothetical protein
VPQPTLSLWLKSASIVSVVNDDDETKPRAKRPEDWTPREKLSAVEEATSLSDAELGGWLRRKGRTEEHLRQWRDTALSGFSTRPSRADGEERKRVKELERELKRKDKALAETAALLVPLRSPPPLGQLALPSGAGERGSTTSTSPTQCTAARQSRRAPHRPPRRMSTRTTADRGLRDPAGSPGLLDSGQARPQFLQFREF